MLANNMNTKDKYKKLVEEVKEKVQRRGKPITNEVIADELRYSREHFQRLYTGKGKVTDKHIEDLVFRYPEVKGLEQNITSSKVNEENATYPTAVFRNPKADDMSKLVDSVWKLSDSVLINSRNIESLIQLKGISYDGSRQNFLVSDPSFPKLVDLLWELARKSGKWEENQFRALVAKLFSKEAVPQP
jgi:hypothetical protein